MNEVALSNDLNVITAEINSYKQVAGQAVFAIGERLNHVKEKDLVHGEFGKWLETVEMDWNTANRFMKISAELNSDTYHNLGSNALYLIATLPESEREKSHELSSGESKTPDEMTVRELQEVKRKLKEAEKREQQAQNMLQAMKNVGPEVVEKEVYPEDYEALKLSNADMKERIKMIDQAKNSDSAAAEKEVKMMRLEADKSVLKIRLQVNEFLQEAAFTSYRRGAIASCSTETKRDIQESMDDLQNFINEMEDALNATIELS